jgi:STE24 endopeptidase
MTAETFSLVFVLALVSALATRLWLAARQLRHVRAHRDAVPAAFAERVGLAAHQKAADYTLAKTRLGMTEAVVDALLVAWLTLGGGAAWLFALCTRQFDSPLLGDMALLVCVALVSGVVSLPFGLYGTFVIEERFGFNKMSFRLWLLDLAKGLVLGAVLGLPLLALVLWLMAKMGALWWLWVWLAWTGFQLLLLAIYPSFIAPLFNKFSPLTEPTLREQVEALLQRCGFRTRGLFVMDGSKRSRHGNAYFTGFGRAKRIVFFDTLLERLTPPEVVAVLAHELGHFKHRHVWKRMAWVFGASLAFLWLLAGLIQAPWFYAGLGMPPGLVPPHHGVALLLFFLALPQFSFLLTPLGSVYSRRHEFEADRYAAEHAASADLVKALVKLYEDNASTLTPDPIHSAFYDSHPPAAVRVARLSALTAGDIREVAA